MLTDAEIDEAVRTIVAHVRNVGLVFVNQTQLRRAFGLQVRVGKHREAVAYHERQQSKSKTGR